MALLIIVDDLKTHFYAEILDEITRSDATITQQGINSAIAEAKSYLSRFHLIKLFGSEAIDPEVIDPNLKAKVKDIAAWHIIGLANPNIHLELFQAKYKDAIDWFKLIQKGQADPEGWPYKPDNPDTAVDESASVQWSSNKKRIQHF